MNKNSLGTAKIDASVFAARLLKLGKPVGMGKIFALAKEFMAMPPGEIEKLLESPNHELRVGAVSIMDWQARAKVTSQARRKELFDLNIRRHDRIPRSTKRQCWRIEPATR